MKYYMTDKNANEVSYLDKKQKCGWSYEMDN